MLRIRNKKPEKCTKNADEIQINLSLRLNFIEYKELKLFKAAD
jgi:hypothetical protein